jgi:hypothetical protein
LILPQVEMKVTHEMNVELVKEFSIKEISDAMFQMGPLKASGPDGFPGYVLSTSLGYHER